MKVASWVHPQESCLPASKSLLHCVAQTFVSLKSLHHWPRAHSVPALSSCACPGLHALQCGQQYGSQSLLIHIPQCYEKWLKASGTLIRIPQCLLDSHAPVLRGLVGCQMDKQCNARFTTKQESLLGLSAVGA